MKKMAILTILFTLTLLTGCDNLRLTNETEVGKYNNIVLERIEGYKKVMTKSQENKEEVYKEIVTNDVKFLEEYGLGVLDMDSEYVDNLKVNQVISHDYYTSLDNETIREIIVLVGSNYKMYVNMLWDKDGQLIYIDRKVK